MDAHGYGHAYPRVDAKSRMKPWRHSRQPLQPGNRWGTWLACSYSTMPCTRQSCIGCISCTQKKFILRIAQPRHVPVSPEPRHVSPGPCHPSPCCASLLLRRAAAVLKLNRSRGRKSVQQALSCVGGSCGWAWRGPRDAL